MPTSSSTTSSIATQVEEFNTGFNEQIGPELADVFRGEQADLVQSGVPDGAVSAGDTVADADLRTPEGAATTLSTALAGRPAVLVFYRGAWCPYCNITLKTYQRKLLPALEERGVGLVAISPQTDAGSAQAVDNGGLTFPVLADPQAALIRSLGILTEPSAEAREAHTQLGFDVADSNADATASIPFPTVLLVDAERLVLWADVHVDYTTRTEIPAVLAALDLLD